MQLQLLPGEEVHDRYHVIASYESSTCAEQGTTRKSAMPRMFPRGTLSFNQQQGCNSLFFHKFLIRAPRGHRPWEWNVPAKCPDDHWNDSPRQSSYSSMLGYRESQGKNCLPSLGRSTNLYHHVQLPFNVIRALVQHVYSSPFECVIPSALCNCSSDILYTSFWSRMVQAKGVL